MGEMNRHFTQAGSEGVDWTALLSTGHIVGKCKRERKSKPHCTGLYGCVAVWTILIASLTVLGLCVASTDPYSLYRAEFFEKLTVPHLVKFPALPCLHEPATCPYHGPDEASPCPAILFL